MCLQASRARILLSEVWAATQVLERPVYYRCATPLYILVALLRQYFLGVPCYAGGGAQICTQCFWAIAALLAELDKCDILWEAQ